MSKQNRIKAVENRPSRTTQERVFTDFTTLGQSLMEQRRYSQQEAHYSEYQNFLYKRAMFGLKMYTEDEIRQMHWQKRNRIAKVHKRTQQELNIWKQSIIVQVTNKILSIFTGSPFTDEIINDYSTPDPTYVSTVSFRDLGITKEQIVQKLLEKGILPYNFKTLQHNEVKA